MVVVIVGSEGDGKLRVREYCIWGGGLCIVIWGFYCLFWGGWGDYFIFIISISFFVRVILKAWGCLLL